MTVDVATLARPLAEVKYGMLPITAALEVARPDQPREPDEPITVREPVSGPVGVRVDVATPYTPAPPLDTRRFDDAG